MAGFGLLLCLTSGIFLILLTVLLIARRDEEVRAQRIAKTPQVPAAHAPNGALAEIVGVAMPSEQGLLRTPSGRAALTYRLEVYRPGKHRTIVTVVRDRRPFYLDDGSGVRARVEPHPDAPVIAGSHEYGLAGANAVVVIGGTPTTYGPITPELAAWMHQYAGNDGSLRATEIVLAPGERIYALGPCVWEGNEPVLRHLGDGDRELLLSNMTEEGLSNLFSTRRTTRLVLLLIAIGIGVAGSALVAAEIVINRFSLTS